MHTSVDMKINALNNLIDVHGTELDDLGFGSAYNMPVYLLEEIEEHVDSVFVIAWDMDGDMPHPRALVGKEEIMPLIEGLEADENGDSWEIALRLIKRLEKRRDRISSLVAERNLWQGQSFLVGY